MEYSWLKASLNFYYCRFGYHREVDKIVAKSLIEFLLL